MRIQDHYSIISGSEMMDKLSSKSVPDIRDFTDNGKCQDCGNCCGNYIPMTIIDKCRIKAYIRTHQIRPAKPLLVNGPWKKPTVHNQCPFLLNSEGKRCAVYPVRPAVCKAWSCHDLMNNQELIKLALSDEMETVNMYLMFYPRETMAELSKVNMEG